MCLINRIYAMKILLMNIKYKTLCCCLKLIYLHPLAQHLGLYYVYFFYETGVSDVFSTIFAFEIIQVKVLLNLTAYIFFIKSYLELILIQNIDYRLLFWKQIRKFVFYVKHMKENHIFSSPFSVMMKQCFPAQVGLIL